MQWGVSVSDNEGGGEKKELPRGLTAATEGEEAAGDGEMEEGMRQKDWGGREGGWSGTRRGRCVGNEL